MSLLKNITQAINEAKIAEAMAVVARGGVNVANYDEVMKVVRPFDNIEVPPAVVADAVTNNPEDLLSNIDSKKVKATDKQIKDAAKNAIKKEPNKDTAKAETQLIDELTVDNIKKLLKDKNSWLSKLIEKSISKTRGGIGGGGVVVGNMVRDILKANFPSIKFKVTSDYSSVNVSYIDGVAENKIEKLLKNFEYVKGYDVTDYELTDFIKDLPQVRYLFINRRISDKALELSMNVKIKDLGIKPNDIDRWLSDFTNKEYLEREAYKYAKITDFNFK